MSAATEERYELRYRDERGIWQIIDKTTGQVRPTRCKEDDARAKHRALNEATS